MQPESANSSQGGGGGGGFGPGGFGPPPAYESRRRAPRRLMAHAGFESGQVNGGGKNVAVAAAAATSIPAANKISSPVAENGRGALSKQESDSGGTERKMTATSAGTVVASDARNTDDKGHSSLKQNPFEAFKYDPNNTERNFEAIISSSSTNIARDGFPILAPAGQHDRTTMKRSAPAAGSPALAKASSTRGSQGTEHSRGKGKKWHYICAKCRINQGKWKKCKAHMRLCCPEVFENNSDGLRQLQQSCQIAKRWY